MLSRIPYIFILFKTVCNRKKGRAKKGPLMIVKFKTKKMKKGNSFGVIFYLKTQKQTNGEAPICVRITVCGNRKEVSLKHKVKPEKWNKAKEAIIGSDPGTKSANHYINEVRARIYEIYKELQLNHKPITAEVIKAKFLGIDENEKTVLQVIKYHNDNMKDSLTWGTAKNYYTTEKYVIEFLKDKMKTTDIFLTQLNYKFLMDFDMFLRNHEPDEKQRPCSNNTVMKHIERFRKIISMAVRNEWLAQDPFLKFKPKFVKKERGFLGEEELKIIEEKELTTERLQVVRDLFIFSCYTGLAYTDSYNLNKSNVLIGIDGKKWITIYRQKTGVAANIPLLPKAAEVIEKYKEHPRCRDTSNLLPMIANQPFNNALKDLAKLCKIYKNLTHHLARHTFATTICLLNGISMESTSGMLGHASMRTTQIYGKILPQRISKEMEALQQKMSVRNLDKLDEKTGS